MAIRHVVRTLKELPEVQWRCGQPGCHAAYQELRAFRTQGLVELDLWCHQCRRITRVIRSDNS